MSPSYMISKLPGATSLLKVTCIISEWTQTWQSTAVYVLEVSYQQLYAVCLVVQCLKDLRGPPRLKLVVLLQDHLSPQLLSAFPNWTTGVSCFFPLVVSKCLHLNLSADCCVFHRTVMIDPFWWVLHSLSNGVRPWDLPLNWILLLACCWIFFSSWSSQFPFLKFFQTETTMGQRCDWDGNPIPHLMSCFSAGGRLYKFPLPTVGHFIKGPSLWVMGVSHLPGLWYILGGSPNLLFPEVACSHSFWWPSVLFPHPILDLVPLPTTALPPCPLSLQSPSFLPHLWLLSSLSQVGLKRPHLGTSACWVFWILWTMSCVFCVFYFYLFFWLISTY
jgi:hypothetical protein